MKRTNVITVVLILSLPVTAFSQSGQAGLSFLKMGVGGRGPAMGETGTAFLTDPSAVHYNPALLTQVIQPHVQFMHKEWIQDIRTEFLGAVLPLSAVTFGFSINSTNISDIEIRTRPGPAEGTFSARYAALGLSAGYRFDDSWGVGASVKYLYEKIFVDEAAGFGLDFGVLYDSPLDVRFGASVSNIGSMNELRTESTKLPTSLRVGAARTQQLSSLASDLTLGADVVSILPEESTHLHAGAEFLYDNTLALRAGILTGYESRTFTAGAGVRWQIFSIDYAFAPLRYNLGSGHTFSLGIRL